jgi:hypothetical protein
LFTFWVLLSLCHRFRRFFCFAVRPLLFNTKSFYRVLQIFLPQVSHLPGLYLTTIRFTKIFKIIPACIFSWIVLWKLHKFKDLFRICLNLCHRFVFFFPYQQGNKISAEGYFYSIIGFYSQIFPKISVSSKVSLFTKSNFISL